jgi:hypothetical protein
MNYFQVTFTATIDNKTETGTTGIQSESKNYGHSIVINRVTEEMKKKYPKAKEIEVKLLAVENLTEQEYKSAKAGFIESTSYKMK